MIISRTPLRLSFLGGGSDYPQYYEKHPGAVLGTTVNRYCYVMLHNGHSWNTFDLPNQSGLGSSSAYTVGLLRACTELDNLTISRLATTWEFDKTGGNVGAQDQYLCAMGGFHYLRFDQHGVRSQRLMPEEVKPLEDYLMLFDTHQYRRSSDLVKYQLAEMERHEDQMKIMVRLANDGLAAIRNQDWRAFGILMNDTWLIKRELSPYISNPTIDAIYETALHAGAVGGKLLGGGGGGFICFVVEPDKQGAVKEALNELTHTPIKFEWEGSQVLYRD